MTDAKMNAASEFGKIYYAEGEYLHYERYWDNLRHKVTFLPKCANNPSEMNDTDYIPSWRHTTFLEPILYLLHELSPLLSITGGRIEKVSCLGTRPVSYAEPHFDYTDIQTALMYNSNDVIFSLRAGFSTPYGKKNHLSAHWYQIKGSKATAETSRSTLDTMKLYRADGEWEAMEWGTCDPSQPEHVRNAAHGGADFYPISHFIDAIVNDKTPTVDVFTAVETAAPTIKAAESAREMQRRGLPYHINIMPKDQNGNFVLSKEDVEELHALGCETAIHYNFTRFPYSPEGHRQQAELYKKAIGDSRGPVNHCLIQIGTAPDALGEWWHARAKCKIDAVCDNGFCIENTTHQKISMVLPKDATAVTVNGKPVTITKKCVGERILSIVSVDVGTHKIEY